MLPLSVEVSSSAQSNFVRGVMVFDDVVRFQHAKPPNPQYLSGQFSKLKHSINLGFVVGVRTQLNPTEIETSELIWKVHFLEDFRLKLLLFLSHHF